MENKQFNTMGLKVNPLVPSTPDEFDKLAGKQGACLAEAVANVIYRQYLTEVRDVFIHGRPEEKLEDGTVVPAVLGLEQRTGIERKTRDTGRTRDVKVTIDGKETTQKEAVLEYAEKESEYIAGVAAQKGWGTSDNPLYAANLQPILDEVASCVSFDPSQRERKSAAPKKLAEQYKNAATRVIDNGNWSKVAAKIKSESNVDIGAPTGNREEDIIALGWAIKSNEDAKRKAAEQEYA